MLAEKIPDQLRFEPIVIIDGSGHQFLGRAAIREWTSKEAFWRGFCKTAKIVGVLIGLPLPLAFLEPFLFMIWGSLVITITLFIVGPVLHLKYWSESTSFFYVESECPHCHITEKLNPYLSTDFQDSFTVICPNCGQTSTASQKLIK